MSLLFPRTEFAGRVAKTGAAMVKAGADPLIVDHAECLAWLSGYMVSETISLLSFVSHAVPPLA